MTSMTSISSIPSTFPPEQRSKVISGMDEMDGMDEGGGCRLQAGAPSVCVGTSSTPIEPTGPRGTAVGQ